MALDCFPNVPLGFLKGLSRCDASRQIRNVGCPIALCLFKNDSVFLAHGFFSRPAGPEDRFQRARWYVIAGMSRNCDHTRFRSVLVMPVAASRPDMPPTIRLNMPHQISNLQFPFIIVPDGEQSKTGYILINAVHSRLPTTWTISRRLAAPLAPEGMAGHPPRVVAEGLLIRANDWEPEEAF